MAINTTTFESRLQAKFDSTTDPKEMLLLGKALESTVGSIAVSNVQTEGTTQVARVVASMTGALPAQAGQAGKVLTSDGTNSTWQEGLPSQSGQGAKFLTTDGTSANWEALSSSALSADFEVEVGKTVSVGDVVNYAAGKIGDNPVVNTQTSLNVDPIGNYDWVLSDGKVVARNTSSGTTQKVTTGIIQSDGSITWNAETDINLSHSGDGGVGITFLGGNKFMVYADGHSNSGAWATSTSSTGYMAFFSVNQTTGLVAKSSQLSMGSSGYYQTWNYYRAYAFDKDTNQIGIYRQSHNYNYNNSPTKTYRYYYDTYTFTDSGSISDVGDNIVEMGEFGLDSMVVTGGKMLAPRSSTTWSVADWNGTSLTNFIDGGVAAEANIDTTYGYRLFRPTANIDKWLMMYIDASLVLKVDTYSYNPGTTLITRTNSHVITVDGAGVSLGNIVGSTSGVVCSYENNTKGYLATFSIDSATYNVTGSGIPVVHNGANSVPQIAGVHNTNKITALYNTAANIAVSSTMTINAFASTPLNWLGVSTGVGAGGDVLSITLDGVATGFSGLVAGTLYYYDTTLYSGAITSGKTDYLIGVAISSTEIKLNA